MPLPVHLANVVLAHPCPHCGNLFQKTGGWFQNIGRYTCEVCKQAVRMTYSDKLALFDRYPPKPNQQEAAN
jgi:transposase-like protein